MRLRNVKNKDVLINNCEIVLKYDDALKIKGNWKKEFKNKNKIELEIGMGKGKFIIEKALNNPDINYIGIEKSDSIIALSTLKIKEPISNLRIINMDASNIENVFKKEISTLYLNFSDPWPKKRHASRRLTSKIFLDKYEQICISPITIFQKTDNRSLFEYSLISYSENGYILKEISFDLYNDYNNDEIISTEYEEKFTKKGNNIYYLKCEK